MLLKSISLININNFSNVKRTRCKASPFRESGYFSEVDVNADIKIKKFKEFDVKKRNNNADFIWNVDWQSHLDMLEERKNEKEEKEEEKEYGFLSLSRINNMNDMEMDYSRELKASNENSISQIDINAKTKLPYQPPTKKEIEEWEHNKKFSIKPVAVVTDEERLKLIQLEKEKYEKEKLELQLWNLATTTFCFSLTLSFYPINTAWSYLLGALGGFVYLNLLSRSVDAIVGQASPLTPPRLLVPIILVMAYNRWNEIGADKTGVQLELLPVLIGFFTYKGALIVFQSYNVVRDYLAEIKRDKAIKNKT